jgi:hypothetical protein
LSKDRLIDKGEDVENGRHRGWYRPDKAPFDQIIQKAETLLANPQIGLTRVGDVFCAGSCWRVMEAKRHTGTRIQLINKETSNEFNGWYHRRSRSGS